jgi:peptidoglycan/xylan/chitin deacetylase (PgdA/CDA1 family)
MFKKFALGFAALLTVLMPLSHIPFAHALGTNLVANPSVETANTAGTLPSNWAQDKWGTNTTTFTYKTNDGHTGTKSLYINMSSRTNGDAKWRSDAVLVKPNQKYTFSDYYKSNVQSEVDLEYTDTTGNISYAWLKNAAASATTWKQTSTTFTTPANVKSVTALHILFKAGWLQTDDYSLNEVSATVAAPTVAITAPVNNSTVSGTQNITTTTTNTIGVQFMLDGTNMGAEDTASPFSASWNTTTTTNGMHSVAAVARNSTGVTASSTITINVQNTAIPTPPTISITAPVNNTTVSGTSQTISANATDSQSVAGVQFKIDGTNIGAEDTTAPYSTNWDTTSVTNGDHTLSATARNGAGLTSTNTVTINVQNVVTPPQTSNLISNPTVEAANGSVPQNWSSGSWGSNTPIFTYETNGHTGNRSVKTQITSYGSGDAKWYFDPVAVEAGKTYDYSHYYQSNVTTDVVAQFTDANGANTYKWLNTLAQSNTWQQFTSSLTIPTGVTKVTILHIVYSVGWVQIDDVSLALSTPPAPGATIPNGSLELSSGSPAMPTNWQKSSWGSNTAKFEYMNEGHTGTHSAKVTVSNYVDGDAKWYFDPITTLQRSKQYRFSTWYKTNSIPHAVAMFIKDDGTEQYFGMPNPQPDGTSNWQYYSETFQVPLDAKAVSVFFFMPNNGWVQVDDQSIANYQPVGFNRPLVSLTFDDGFEENNQSVLPMTATYGFKTTQCYATQFIQQDPNNPNLILAFKNQGHEICSHTVTHPFLTQLTVAQMDNELSNSQQYLQNLIGAPVRDFASPYGDYNESVNNEIKKYYRSHRTVDEGYNSKDNFDIYRIRVQNMTPTTTLAQYQSWLDQAKADNTWLVLVYHKVWTTGIGPYDTYQSDFAQQLQAIANSGVTVKTYSDALDEVVPQL